jgi:RNA polymerase sigma-70 factor (ECF subfamily)
MDDRASEDQRIVRAILQGDRDAFAALVRRYQKLVVSVAWRYGVRPEETEDVVSEAFFKAYRNLDRYQPDHPFSTWLYRLAVNHVLDHGRRARRRGQDVELPERLDDPGPAPDELASRNERAGLVRAALATLHPRYREVLFLVYVESHSVEEASRALGLPEGTIKSRLLRGRAALRQALLRRHPTGFAGLA